MSDIKTLQGSCTDDEPSRVGFFVGHWIVVGEKIPSDVAVRRGPC